MNRNEAYNTLVQNYLNTRKVEPKYHTKLQKQLIEMLTDEKQQLITPVKDLILENIVKTEKTAFVDAQTLSGRIYEISKINEKDLKKKDCSYRGDGSARKDALQSYDESLAEDVAEKGLYEHLGERP